MHGLFFTEEAERAREFFAEALELDAVDAGDGWLIFDVPDAEFGVHPLEAGEEGFHDISFWCEDIETTVETLESRGVTFTRPIQDEDWGRTTSFELPGGVPVGLYEPKHDQP